MTHGFGFRLSRLGGQLIGSLLELSRHFPGFGGGATESDECGGKFSLCHKWNAPLAGRRPGEELREQAPGPVEIEK
jgi:hypothetical protein